ncbi:hypothetical protein JRQ81_013922 [Phrynocephalus forsythii]|uniref:Uncharacterized protein n=1 Tax=Phrynocephalus forsythii TaxID=171643 RepID=A0A9Q1B2B6_9SAUR|nr:hypothetical protein JRQ81_013922 [Phrynocephalus forsythii]
MCLHETKGVERRSLNDDLLALLQPLFPMGLMITQSKTLHSLKHALRTVYWKNEITVEVLGLMNQVKTLGASSEATHSHIYSHGFDCSFLISLLKFAGAISL